MENPSADSPAAKPFVVSRLLAAPRRRVFQAWTEAAHLMKWFGPRGAGIPACSLDLRPGGCFHYCMRLPDGQELWGKWVFVEIEPPRRIVLISSFSDEQGQLARHPMSPTWPLETRSTTTLREQEGKTLLTIEWLPHHASAEERATFDGAHESMRLGWGGTLDQLRDYLADDLD